MDMPVTADMQIMQLMVDNAKLKDLLVRIGLKQKDSGLLTRAAKDKLHTDVAMVLGGVL